MKEATLTYRPFEGLAYRVTEAAEQRRAAMAIVAETIRPKLKFRPETVDFSVGKLAATAHGRHPNPAYRGGFVGHLSLPRAMAVALAADLAHLLDSGTLPKSLVTPTRNQLKRIDTALNIVRG